MADIAFRSIAKSYGQVHVIKQLDLEIKSGEFIVLLGESGCGKTTLLRMLAGLEAISGGTATIDGAVVNDLEPKDRGCAMVFQNYALFPHMIVRDNLSYGMRLAKIPKDEQSSRIAEAARMLNISHLLDRKPSQLSGGQRQRVAIGRAMVRQPRVFLFDEPLSNLDAKLRSEMRIELRRLHDALGSTSIFVTHDQAEAMTLADRIVVMNKGKIEQIGTPREIYHEPRTRFVAGFIGSPPANLVMAAVRSDSTGNLVADVLGVPVPVAAEVGTVLTAAIRPEDLVIAPEGIVAEIFGVEYLGNTTHIHCRAHGSDVIVAGSPQSSLQSELGQTWLTFDPSKVRFFDQEGDLVSAKGAVKL